MLAVLVKFCFFHLVFLFWKIVNFVSWRPEFRMFWSRICFHLFDIAMRQLLLQNFNFMIYLIHVNWDSNKIFKMSSGSTEACHFHPRCQQSALCRFCGWFTATFGKKFKLMTQSNVKKSHMFLMFRLHGWLTLKGNWL